MTLTEFKLWLTQLIFDKQGALPDFNDWKVIKEKLDTVHDTEPLPAFNLNLMDDLRYFNEKLLTCNKLPETYKYLQQIKALTATLNGRQIDLENNYDTTITKNKKEEIIPTFFNTYDGN